MIGRRDLGFISGVSLVHECQFHRFASHLVHGLSRDSHMVPILFISRSVVQRQEVSQGVDDGVDIGTLTLFVPVVARPSTALDGGQEGAAIENDRRGFGPCGRSQSESEHEARERWSKASGGQPSSCLLVDHLRGTKVLGKELPGGAATYEPTEGIEDIAQVIDAFSDILR